MDFHRNLVVVMVVLPIVSFIAVINLSTVKRTMPKKKDQPNLV